MSVKYIHYGSEKFDPTLFISVMEANCYMPGGLKPFGRLWASPVNSNNSWNDWCIDNEFELDLLNSSFIFSLRNDTKIFKINSTNDLSNSKYFKKSDFIGYIINYAALILDGYDGIEVTMNPDLYFALYGWDVDSLLIFNSDCIVLE